MLIFFSIAFNSFSQKYYFDTYGVEEGLNASKVYFLLQDRNDYLWLGTEGGISRFDGTGFKNFSPEEGLADNGVYCIFEDHRGKIWFGHLGGGITIYDGEKFEQIIFDSIEIKGDITSIRAVEQDALWISTIGSGILKVLNYYGPPKSMEVKQYKGGEGLSDLAFNITITRDRGIYCITDVGIKKYNKESDRFESFSIPGLTRYFLKTTMFEDSRGNLWFGTHNGGLYKYDKSSDTMIIYDKHDVVTHNWISCINEDSERNVWIGTFGGGITVFNNNGTKNYNTSNGLNNNEIKCIITDHEGNILIGTQTQGMSIFKGEQFVTIDSEDGLVNSNVWAIQQDRNGKYWFGTNKGIAVYDPDGSGEERFVFYNRENSTIPDKIRFLKKDRDNNIWIGTDGGGVLEYRAQEERFIYNTYLNKNLYRDQIVKALELDKNNHLWIGTNDGLAFWDPIKEEGARFSQIDGLAGNGITALYADKKGNVWIGSERRNGLTCYNIDKEEFSIIDLGIEIAPTSITEDINGKIWLGTTRGVYAWDGDSVVVHLTTEKDGLLTNFINLLVVDENNNLFIGTNKGLNKYDQEKNKVYTYTRKSGFVGIESRDNAVFKDNLGNIWFGTANGVTKMDPKKVRTQQVEPLTHIAGMQVNFKSMEMIPGLRLNHKENQIIFNYYSICLTDPEAVEYEVMLEGYHDDWQKTNQTQYIYSALGPNKYNFKVRASNSYGEYNKQPVSYRFNIMSPIYQRWWFILITFLTIVGLIFVYIKIRERALRRENRILEEKVALRTKQVVQKSKELEQKNKDITDSIRYAKRIQSAILPPEDSIASSFILFKPKDIVSGDFYWLTVDGSKQFIAAVDCTGHGVPGAFMSIIGHNSLNKIVKEYGLKEPATILDHLNDEVVNTLQQQADDGEVKDGMDLALLVYDMETHELEYAGAYNPLYLIRNNELNEIKGDRFSIGRSSSESAQKFTNHKLKIQTGDTTYIFSDGYADQFGGPKGKKFMIKALKEILIRIQHLEMEKQKLYLDETIENWKGKEEQIDDILIIGIRFSN